MNGSHLAKHNGLLLSSQTLTPVFCCLMRLLRRLALSQKRFTLAPYFQAIRNQNVKAHFKGVSSLAVNAVGSLIFLLAVKMATALQVALSLSTAGQTGDIALQHVPLGHSHWPLLLQRRLRTAHCFPYASQSAFLGSKACRLAANLLI